jgi:hypothetical protein
MTVEELRERLASLSVFLPNEPDPQRHVTLEELDHVSRRVWTLSGDLYRAWLETATGRR